jgi:transposase
MVVVGADVHKRTHTFVAVDEVGKRLDEKVVRATTSGHHKALRWARERFGAEVVWAIEDCRHLSARLERDLLAAGQQVVRVPPKLMAQVRASARTRGKSDPRRLGGGASISAGAGASRCVPRRCVARTQAAR